MNKIEIDKTSYMGTYMNNWGAPINIGKYCSIGNMLTIVSSSHPPLGDPDLVSNYPFKEKLNVDYPICEQGMPVQIANDVWIGEHVTIIAPVRIGNGVIIGAGSVVASDVSDYSISFGNPCKHYRYRFTMEQYMKLNKIQWWNWSEQMIRERINDLKNIEVFLQKYGQ